MYSLLKAYLHKFNSLRNPFGPCYKAIMDVKETLAAYITY